MLRLTEEIIVGLTQFLSGNWVFLKGLLVGTHVIYFKGDLKSINATTTYYDYYQWRQMAQLTTYAGPYGWDSHSDVSLEQ